jgi:hypothetical protein
MPHAVAIDEFSPDVLPGCGGEIFPSAGRTATLGMTPSRNGTQPVCLGGRLRHEAGFNLMDLFLGEV